MLVSRSDDCKVKVWCTNQEASVLNIDRKANICFIKDNPGSNMYIAVGSADHHILYYDLRNTRKPVHIFCGHRKAGKGKGLAVGHHCLTRRRSLDFRHSTSFFNGHVWCSC